MSRLDSIRQSVARVIAGQPSKAANSMSLPRELDFARYGGTTIANWPQLRMGDQDKYTGFMYGAIRKRANRVAQLAEGSLKTRALPALQDKAKAAREDLRHPYLDIIDSSPQFSNYQFWYAVSLFLDLKGFFPLYVRRTVAGQVVGTPQEFKLLNPARVTRKRSTSTFEIIAYTETRPWDGATRDFLPEEIIDMVDLTPFDKNDPFTPDKPFPVADAAADPQSLLRESSAYTQSRLKDGINAPGIFSGDVQLGPEEEINLRARLAHRRPGEPLFAFGKGALKYDDMQTDLNKAALDKIASMSLEEIIAVTGVSKTMLGIEVSGVTRDTSKVQSDLFVTSEAMPRLQMIIDALNQDYKNRYSKEDAKTKYRLYIDSPLGTDRDAELKDVKIRSDSADLYHGLVGKGYDAQLAARYVGGEITLEELGKPTNPPEPAPAQPAPADPQPADPAADNALSRNALAGGDKLLLDAQEGTLLNTVTIIEQRVVSAAIAHVTANAYDQQADVIAEEERRQFEVALQAALAAFYLAIVPLYAATNMSRRSAEYGLLTTFELTVVIREGIERVSHKAALSHISTVLDDVLKAARQASLAGANQSEIAAAIRREYSNIAGTRAKTIARTETNRAYSMGHFESDKQFLTQNEMLGKAYKKYVNHGPDPCVFCRAKAAEPAIPFEQPFFTVGETYQATETRPDGTTVVHAYPVTYEDVDAGDIHPNGHCDYQLIVES